MIVVSLAYMLSPVLNVIVVVFFVFGHLYSFFNAEILSPQANSSTSYNVELHPSSCSTSFVVIATDRSLRVCIKCTTIQIRDCVS